MLAANLAKVAQALQHGRVASEEECVVRVVRHAAHLETGAISAEELDLPVLQQPGDGLLSDVRALVRCFRAVLVLAPLPQDDVLADLDIPRGPDLIECYRLVDLLVAEVQSNRRSHEHVER